MKSAKLFFVAGSWILLFSGILHFIGQFGGRSNTQFEAITILMKDYRRAAVGLNYNLWGVMQAWGIGFGVTIFFLGLQNLLTAGTLAADAAALRRAAATSCACATALVAMAIGFQIAPPAILLAPAALCFLMAALPAG